MSNTSVDLFLRDISVLAKTMVIHSVEVAGQVNTELKNRYPTLSINDNLPETWKYYMNMAGEYHETDKIRIAEINGDGNPYMTIKVAGDNASIVVNFTKDLISGDRADVALATEYAYGSNFYNELVSRYPEFETLILGILNPIEYDISTKSYNGDILYAGGWYRVYENNNPDQFYFVEKIKAGVTSKPLVETNEYSLLFKLESWIKNTMEQWIVKDFIPNNDLYVPAIWATIMAKLPVQIFNLRLANIKSNTGQTHSFHYIEYLNSHGDLGKYVPYLTLDQALFLYKNMGWLETNIGKQEVFDSLIENLLTPAGVPIAAYILKHNLSEIKDTTYTEPFMERNYLNFRSIGAGSDARSIEEIVKKSVNLARDNGLNIEDQIKSITNLSRQSINDKMLTKVLESDMMDNRDSIRYPKAHFLLNMWLYSVKYGSYKGSIFITHPITGQRLQLTPLNAFILMYYSFCRGYCNTTLTTFPNLKARIIPKTNTPPLPTLSKLPTVEEMKWCIDSPKITNFAIYKLIKNKAPTFKYRSTLEFNNEATEQHSRLMERWYQAMTYEDLVACGQFDWLVKMHYWFDVDVGKLTNLPMDEWLKNFGIDVSGMSDNDFRLMAADLIKNGTGALEHDGDWLSEMQGAVLDILQYFSSYTIQIIKTFRNGSAIRAGFKTLRMGGETYTGSATGKINITNRSLENSKVRAVVKREVVSALRTPTFDNIQGYQKSTLGKATKRYTSVPFRVRQRINVTNRMRITQQGALEDFTKYSAYQSGVILPTILSNKAVGLEIGGATLQMDNDFTLTGYQSDEMTAINGYQVIAFKTTFTVEQFKTTNSVTITAYQSSVIEQQ